MFELKEHLRDAIRSALPPEGRNVEIHVQDTPPNRPGDFGTPVAFALAQILGTNPALIAADIVKRLDLPKGIDRVEIAGPYINFFVEPAFFVAGVVQSSYRPKSIRRKVIIEHTSVNPNKEWHVGHIRGALIGDVMARIYRATGYTVEVHNYIDDTGRQAAESIFAALHYGETWDGVTKYDHWLGNLYVRLHRDLADPETRARLEPGISEVIHRLEKGEMRAEIERVVRAHLETAYSLGVQYNLLTWESDVIRAGFVSKAIDILSAGPYLSQPVEGEYAGTLGLNISAFAPGLEEPYKVLVRSDGTYVYVTKDIGLHYWKFGLLNGLNFVPFDTQLEDALLWTTTTGKGDPTAKRFGGGDIVINVIDTRQTLLQVIVKASLAILEYGQQHAENFHHLANETVLLEGKTMSGRKGITIAADAVIAEACERAKAVIADRVYEFETPSEIARKVGIGALRFGFLKAEPSRKIDFRWDQVLSLQGDTAPVVQYAFVRAQSIVRKAEAAGLTGDPDWSTVGSLEVGLARVLLRYPEVLAVCIRDNTPHFLVAYALELADTFNAYFNHKGQDGKPDTGVLTATPGLREARVALVRRVAMSIAEVLSVLGVEVPEEM